MLTSGPGVIVCVCTCVGIDRGLIGSNQAYRTVCKPTPDPAVSACLPELVYVSWSQGNRLERCYLGWAGSHCCLTVLSKQRNPTETDSDQRLSSRGLQLCGFRFLAENPPLLQ
ncbi:hypothetical protein AHF37_06583 [Paragonimus kellicotti]|nr:hypothetical protein AHF37_06583 [Paragonimus kellicotti]